MKKIYLIDGNSFIYRMFFALPEFSTKDGKVVNALFGMAKFFVSSLVKQNPDYIVFVKDAYGDNFRHDIYADYKSTRDRMPDNLRTQIGDIETMIKKMGIDIIEIGGFEADDVIGTLSVRLGKDENNEIYILSGDKDLYSLITENVSVYDTMKRKVFNPEKTKEKFGVEPKLIIDYLSIVGDKADNIPGIDGFGPKKAVDLINNIGTIDKIFIEVDNVKNEKKTFLDFDKSIQSCFKGKTFEKLLISKEDAFLSKRLATIELDMDLGDFDLEKFKFKPDNLLNKDVIDFFHKHEFHSLVGEDNVVEMKNWDSLGLKSHIINNKNNLDNLFKLIKTKKEIVLDTETTSLDIMEAKLVGISIYIDDEKIYYINKLHEGEKVLDIDLKKFLNDVFSLDILIIGHNIKYDLEILELYLKGEKQSIETSENLGQISLNF